MKIFKMIKLADLFTMANLVCGFLALLLLVNTKTFEAAIFIIIAAVFDFFDGKVARMQKSANLLGKQLDSLADLVSFGVAPAMLGYVLGLNSNLAVVILTIYVVAGMLRLARFNVTKSKDFEGLPITHGIIYALLHLFMPFNQYILILYAVSALAMISSIKIKKV